MQIVRGVVVLALWMLPPMLTRASEQGHADMRTLAERLMEVELQARKDVPAQAPALLSQVLKDAVGQLSLGKPAPETRLRGMTSLLRALFR